MITKDPVYLEVCNISANYEYMRKMLERLDLPQLQRDMDRHEQLIPDLVKRAQLLNRWGYAMWKLTGVEERVAIR